MGKTAAVAKKRTAKAEPEKPRVPTVQEGLAIGYAAIDEAARFLQREDGAEPIRRDIRFWFHIAIERLAKHQAAVSPDRARDLCRRLVEMVHEIDPDAGGDRVETVAGSFALAAAKDFAQARWRMYDAADTMRELLKEFDDFNFCDDDESSKTQRMLRDLTRLRAERLEESANALNRWLGSHTQEDNAPEDGSAKAGA